MKVEYRVFNKNNPADSLAIAKMQSELLPHSPLVLLGMDFMSKFYYAQLPKLDLINGFVCYIDNEAAGFIVATNDPSGFMSKAIRKNWYKLIIVLLVSILKEPSRLKPLREAWQIMSHLPETAKKSNTGELLSLGVLEKYRTNKFQKLISQNLSKELVLKAEALLEQQDCSEVRVVVDDDNTVAKFFYHSLGWRLGEKVTGWKVPTIEFIHTITTSDNK